MIFTPLNVHLIASGKKTQTRRPVKGDEPCRYLPSKSYAVQPGRGRPASLRITVVEVRHELVGAISFDDARAEGFRTTDEFKAEWVRIHDKSWVARCELNRDGEPMAEFDLVERFGRRHADRPVWVITFAVSREDRPRFLGSSSPLVASGKARVLSTKKRKPRAAKLPERALTNDQAAGYVESAAMGLPHEPEPVSESEQKWITAQAGMTTQQWRALEAAQTERDAYKRSVDERVRIARQKAATAGVDVSMEVFKVRKIQQDGADPEKLERWLQALERKAFTTTIGRAA